jgi:PAS domain S-box-containing protein
LVVPILLIQAYIYYDLFRTRRATELQANLELARSIGVAFNGFVQDVLHQEISIAIAATASPPLSLQDLTKALHRSAGYYDSVGSFSWVGPEGRVLASTSPELIGIELTHREYLQEIMSGREWAVSNLFLSDTGEPTFTISHCIRDEKGGLLGMVAASVRAGGLQEVLSIERAKDAGISLVDRNGMVVVTYPAREFTWEQRNWLELYPQKIEEAIEGTEIATTVESGRTGKKRLVGVAPIPSIGWVAAASRAEEDAMGHVVSNLLTHGALFLIVTLAAFGTALALYRPISLSIRRLRDQTLALGQGRIENLAVLSGPSEIEELAEAFNNMAEEVRIRQIALGNSEERFRILAEKSLVGVYLIQDDLFRYVNPAFAQVLGYGCEEIIDRVRPEDTLLPEDREAVMGAISRRITGELLADNREFHIIRKDGAVREVEIYGVRVVHKGHPAILGTLIDITERKRMEKELQLARDELENRVRERTAELARRNKELENFTFVAAHDLQEPLRKIQTFGDLILNFSESMDEQAVDYIERMRETALRMQQVLQSLLTYSRITSKPKPFARVDLTNVAMEVVTDLELRIREASGSVEIEKLPEIEADAGQMRQLFQNLLGNGLKFRREGEPPKVRVYAECEQNILGGECRIFVEDNGIGFEEKYLDKIFQPFQRLHGRTEYPGTGIGLAICSKIVERHGGTITASSIPGKGSTFVVSLPLKQNHHEV